MGANVEAVEKVLDASIHPASTKKSTAPNGVYSTIGTAVGINERDDNVAKFWLDPVRLQSSGGFSRFEINRIERLVSDSQRTLSEAWNEYFRG